MAKQKTDPTDPLVVSPFPPEGGNAQAGDLPAPPFAAPKAADAAGPLPRAVPELARAARGTTRFKVRVSNYAEQGNSPLYVLTAEGDEEAAKACFLEASGLGEYVARLKRQAGRKADEVAEPVFVVTRLAD